MSYTPYMVSVDYNNLVSGRLECFKRFRTLLDVPIVKSPYTVCANAYGPKKKVLDIGAGVDHPLKQFVGIDDESYFSMDNDPCGEFNFEKLEEIPPDLKFDLIVMNQVLEHLTINDGIDTMRDLREKLTPGGRLVISIPNAHHPVRYHSAVTHVTNWPYNELYAMLSHLGYGVPGIYRSNKVAFPKNPVRRWVLQMVCEELRIDWCDTLIVEATSKI